jgi:hypothetical protein
LNRKSAALRNTFALIILTENICAVNKLEQLNEPLNLLLIRLKNDFEVIKSGTDYDSLFNNYLATFENYKSRISQMFFDELRFRNIKEELKKIYADSLKYFDLSIKTKNENELHEWRKNVKDLYYCFFSLTPLWKPVISVFTKELKTLSDLLGDLHDLFELKIYIQSLIDNPFDFTEIISVIELNQVEIIEKSISLGKRLFAEDEEQFALRIKSYFSVFKKEQKMLAPKS